MLVGFHEEAEPDEAVISGNNLGSATLHSASNQGFV